MMRGRLRLRRRHEEGEPGGEPQDYIEIDPSQLTGIFSVPQWLRDIGLMAWLLVGIALFLVGSVWLMTLTSVIVVPVIVAASSPRWDRRSWAGCIAIGSRARSARPC